MIDERTLAARRAQRIDERLADQLRVTRSRARDLIVRGDVYLDGMVMRKAGARVDPQSVLHVAQEPRYVSRSGEKLAFALEAFDACPLGVRCIDLGISTGGFTDCLLQNGAAHVVGVDVGHDQTVAAIRNDPRVALFEGHNVRSLTLDQLNASAPFEFATIDLSFISLRLVLVRAATLLKAGARCIALVKPQFEAGRARLGRGGVVRDDALRRVIVEELAQVIPSLGFSLRGSAESPVPGMHGNREVFFDLVCEPVGSCA